MHAIAYTGTRLQGVHVTGMLDPNAPQVPIIEHPVVRMLLWMKSYVEGMRMLTYFLGKNLDVEAVDQGEKGREAKALTGLLIPLPRRVIPTRLACDRRSNPGLRRLRLLSGLSRGAVCA